MAKTPPSPSYLSSAEVCDRIGIDRSTLSRWIKFGDAKPAMQLPGTKGAYLFTEDEASRLKAEWILRRRKDRVA